MKELKEKFLSLSEEEKMIFCQEIMPEIGQMLKKNPQKMIREMMPIIKELIEKEEIDLVQLMGMIMAEEN
ncbi:hypothetical protein [Natronospora cellulosivora (SeqCode)]